MNGKTEPPMLTQPITTFTTYAFTTSRAKFWAFSQMGLAGSLLEQADGLRFWKMLGSGKGAGFSINPNWSRYAMLAVWEDEETARKFFAESEFSVKFEEHAAESWTVYLAATRAHGEWDGQNPFRIEKSDGVSDCTDGPIAVLTRATVDWRKLHRFWRHVPSTSRAIEGADGVLASIGVGEVPFVRQATLSFWQSADHMQEFAYRSSIHKEIVRKTRQEAWYSEDMFARFVPIRSEGMWDGYDPLAGVIGDGA